MRSIFNMVSHAPRSLTLVNKRRRHNDRTSMHDFSFVAPPHIKERTNATHAIDFAILLFAYAIYFWCFEVRPLCWRTSHGENCRRASHIDVFESCVYCFCRGCRFKIKNHFPNLRPKLHRSRKFGCLAKFLRGLFWFMARPSQISKRPVLHPSGQNLTKARP